MGVKFEVFHDAGYGEREKRRIGWHWRLRGANGEIMAQSEGYTRKADAARGVFDVVDAIESGYELKIIEPGSVAEPLEEMLNDIEAGNA